MKTGTMLLVGAGVVAGGAGLVWWARTSKKDASSNKARGRGRLKRPPKSASKRPKRTQPKATPKDAGETEVFTLSASEAKAMACDLRAAENVGAVKAVVDDVLAQVEASGAREVDLRSSGLTEGVVTVEEFKLEAASLLRELRFLPHFLWGQAKAKIDASLSSLPGCDAPLSQWEAMFGGAGGERDAPSVMAAVRPPPFTLLQGIRPLRG